MAYGKWSKRERSPEPPSFRASKQLKMSYKNQTKVAMGITGQLLRTKGKDKNVVYSPLSIHVVLSMIASGASKGPSMDQLLYFLRAKSVSELNDLASSLVPLVFADGSPSGGPRLSFANGVWLEDSVSIKTPFKEAVDLSYKALLKQVGFKTKSEEVRCEVNAWVEKQTNGLIKDIIPPGLVDSSTDIILANALYFKGAWDKNVNFHASNTREWGFHLQDGRSVKAQFMTSGGTHYVSVFDGFKVLRLPYEQGQDCKRRFSMCVFLPNERDGLPALVERVSTEFGFLDRHIPRERVRVGRFLIPKFKISSDFDCIKVLEPLGLKLPCLTEMVEGKPPFVNIMLHKAFIEVNEEGTEAAAATVACGMRGAGRRPPPQIDFVADHPFLFLVREEVTGTVLFVGHVLNPTKEE